LMKQRSATSAEIGKLMLDILTVSVKLFVL
jgi:hypothetical protein